MGKSLAAALLLMPVAAQGERLLVEYQGTVSSIERASSLAEMPPYSVGDAIHGTLIIDTLLAPADRVADSSEGRYYDESPLSNFVLGPPRHNEPASTDLVVVHNDWAPSAGTPTEDGIVIRDGSFGIDGPSNLVLGLQRPNLFGQLFSSDSLTQSFAVEQEPGTTLWGYLERGFGEFWRLATFAIDRLSVTPGVCRAPR